MRPSSTSRGRIAETHDEIVRAFAHWDDIDIHVRGSVVTSTGHGFAGMSRQLLLDILQRRCRSLGVELQFETEVRDLAPYREADLILAADGVNSAIRARHAEHFGRQIEWRPNRFVWLGTTCPFPAFTFIFKEDVHGLWRVHAYRYDAQHSTFILETTDATWRRAGLDEASEDDTVAFIESLFADELKGHPILKNRSLWRNFPVVRNERWSHRNVVLVGDAAHTAHFSVGSGTKLAMEDAIALSRALGRHGSVPAALEAYEAERRPEVESLQRAAQVSLEWFETTERYHRLEPIQFAMSLLTRSLRVTHDNLKVRDPRFVADGGSLVRGGRRAAERHPALDGPRAASAAHVHALPAPGPRAVEPDRRVAHVSVLGRGRHAQRLAPRPPRQPRDGRRRARRRGDDRREPRGPDQPGLHGDVQARARRRVEAHRRLRPPAHAGRASRSSWPTPGARARRGGCGRGSTSRSTRATGPSSRRRRSRTSRTARSRAR